MKKALVFVTTFAAFLITISYLSKRTAAPTRNSEGLSCDMSLWEHVYHGRFASAQDRLEVLDPCTTVSGTIVKARPEPDGDLHIQLDLDPEFDRLLNQVNVERQNGYLVLETMCSNHASQTDTLEEGVCDNFAQSLFYGDLIGQRVRVTGAYVRDREHGWTEIHPVTSIVPAE